MERKEQQDAAAAGNTQPEHLVESHEGLAATSTSSTQTPYFCQHTQKDAEPAAAAAAPGGSGLGGPVTPAAATTPRSAAPAAAAPTVSAGGAAGAQARKRSASAMSADQDELDGEDVRFNLDGTPGKYAFNLTGSSKDVQDEANELETELLQELHAHLLLQAGRVYQQREADGWHDEDTPQDERAWDAAAQAEADSSDDEDDEDSDAEAEAAHQAAVRRSKQRRSWKPTKSEVLIILVGMMLLGELLVFLDMAGLFNSRRR